MADLKLRKKNNTSRSTKVSNVDLSKKNCDAVLRRAKSFASSGKIEDDLSDIPIDHQYLEAFGHLEGSFHFDIFEDSYTPDPIEQDIAKRWYEEKNNYNGHSYSPEIANFTRMLWNASNEITCATCNEDNKHYIVCMYTNDAEADDEPPENFIPFYNADPTQEQFKKNVFFINNNNPTTATTSTHGNYENRSHTPCPLMKNLLAVLTGTLDMCAAGVTPSRRASSLIIHNLHATIADAQVL